jgi:hypothetical protein
MGWSGRGSVHRFRGLRGLGASVGGLSADFAVARGWSGVVDEVRGGRGGWGGVSAGFEAARRHA